MGSDLSEISVVKLEANSSACWLPLHLTIFFFVKPDTVFFLDKVCFSPGNNNLFDLPEKPECSPINFGWRKKIWFWPGVVCGNSYSARGMLKKPF